MPAENPNIKFNKIKVLRKIYLVHDGALENSWSCEMQGPAGSLHDAKKVYQEPTGGHLAEEVNRQSGLKQRVGAVSSPSTSLARAGGVH